MEQRLVGMIVNATVSSLDELGTIQVNENNIFQGIFTLQRGC